MSDCIFCRIGRREAASYVLYEDEDMLAFLDIHPVCQGHTLVVPKLHFESAADMDDELLGKIIVAAKRISD